MAASHSITTASPPRQSRPQATDYGRPCSRNVVCPSRSYEKSKNRLEAWLIYQATHVAQRLQRCCLCSVTKAGPSPCGPSRSWCEVSVHRRDRCLVGSSVAEHKTGGDDDAKEDRSGQPRADGARKPSTNACDVTIHRPTRRHRFRSLAAPRSPLIWHHAAAGALGEGDPD